MPVFKFISRLIDDEDPVIIMPFSGYANSEKVYAQARVLEDEGIVHSQSDSFIKNFYNSFKRFESDEIENALVKVSIDTKEISLRSDKEGYVYIDATHAIKRTDETITEWFPVTYKLIVDDS